MEKFNSIKRKTPVEILQKELKDIEAEIKTEVRHFFGYISGNPKWFSGTGEHTKKQYEIVSKLMKEAMTVQEAIGKIYK